jgi:hypothetical protein
MTRGTWLTLLFAFGLSVGIAYGLRFALVENEDVAVACAAGSEGVGCLVREIAIFTFHHLLLGGLALAGGLLALAYPRRWTMLLALVPAAFGLVLYNVEMAATAVMLCLFATARVGARTARG